MVLTSGYRKTGNFCGVRSLRFLTKKKTFILIFADFFSAD
jgi:hypothetical protein